MLLCGWCDVVGGKILELPSKERECAVGEVQFYNGEYTACSFLRKHITHTQREGWERDEKGGGGGGGCCLGLVCCTVYTNDGPSLVVSTCAVESPRKWRDGGS